MSTVRRYHLRCDGWQDNHPGCQFQVGERSSDPRDPYPAVDPYGGYTVAEERGRAVAAGWTREGKKDFCPPCTERRKAGS